MLKNDPEGKKFEILLIDKNEHFEFICSNYKSLTDEANFDELTIKHQDSVASYGSKNVSFK